MQAHHAGQHQVEATLSIVVETVELSLAPTAAQPAANLDDLRSAFKIVLDQYNRHLGFAIDVSQKCLGTVFVFASLFYSIHKLSDKPAPLGVLAFVVIVVTSLLALGLFLWMQRQYLRRCQACNDFLATHTPVAHPYGLPSLGILPGEHTRIICMWSTIFACVLLGLLVLITGYFFTQP